MNYYRGIYVKKFFSILLAVMFLLSCFSLSAFAVSNSKLTTTNIKDGDVEYLSDGSYIVTTITSEETTLMRSTSKTLTKSVRVYNSDKEETCRLTLKSVFSINNGSSVTCTSSSCSTTIYQDGWSIVSTSATRSNKTSYATATATGTAKKKVLGITTKSIPLSTTITCYKDGSYK